MQVAKGYVVEDVRETRDGHGLHTTDGEVSLALTDFRSGAGHDERVADSDASRVPAYCSIFCDQLDCATHHGIVTALERLICAKFMTDEIGVEKRQGVDEYFTELVGQNDRTRKVFGVTDDPDARAQHARIGRETLTAVVIARNDDNGDRRLTQSQDRVIKDAECLNRGYCAVEDVTGNDEEINLAVNGLSHQQVDSVALSLDQGKTVKGAP